MGSSVSGCAGYRRRGERLKRVSLRLAEMPAGAGVQTPSAADTPAVPAGRPGQGVGRILPTLPRSHARASSHTPARAGVPFPLLSP